MSRTILPCEHGLHWGVCPECLRIIEAERDEYKLAARAEAHLFDESREHAKLVQAERDRLEADLDTATRIAMRLRARVEELERRLKLEYKVRMDTRARVEELEAALRDMLLMAHPITGDDHDREEAARNVLNKDK